MEIVNGKDVDEGLKDSGRVYLCGNLKMSNGVRHVQTDGYEIGISKYSEFTFEKAHIHTFNQEYNYIIEGEAKVFLLNEEKEYYLSAGDLYVIKVNEPYVGKYTAGTKIIFSKDPGGNDKQLVEMNDRLMKWGESWEATYN